MLKVNNKGVKNIDDFIDAILSVKNGGSVKLKLLSMENSTTSVSDLKVDLSLWATRELVRNNRSFQWVSSELQHQT